jgi:hypothetical protein
MAIFRERANRSIRAGWTNTSVHLDPAPAPTRASRIAASTALRPRRCCRYAKGSWP